MADILKKLYNACNPLEPASHEYFVSSNPARGSCDLTFEFSNSLRSIEKDFLCFLFSGHVGCGKSSELHHLAEELKKPAAGSQPCFPIIIDAGEFLDEYNVVPSDILLALVSQVAFELEQAGIGLQDSYFLKKWDEIKGILFREVALEDGSFSFSKVTANIKLLKRDPEARDKVRKALETRLSSLRDQIRLFFEKARSEVKKKNYSDFILIIDNLEKIQRIEKINEGYESHRELFINRSPQLTGLGAHVVYTVPLPLVLSDGPELLAKYGTTPFVLPMIKVFHKRAPNSAYDKGYDTLRELIKRRVGQGAELTSIIKEDALKFLFRYSGGNTRQLLMFLRESSVHTDQPPITLEVAQRAISETVSIYSRLPKSYWPKLAALEKSSEKNIDISDPEIKTMLHSLCILEYRNGDQDDAFNSPVPWYAVHPIIRELRTFKDAVKRKKKPKAAIKSP
ncbi:MAG TPA: hypothetical protein VM658_04085 [bacterium]|nr:hypothetical protein [bacterium]